ncbi:glycosyltransferase family 2 protein [Phormidium sp. FACHB-592]|uniref:Glycosyltransferase family 2 protein n=1 Tax=Stenomitos frigidus AS-A4 TaxID=2933935 RepID=A0ABV0KNW7_9CYAN|nr:glycosyltransferase family A protein [Phormidium sp. FACHB-592]MBD2072862.1 glycosyltransferase family 2 protein [Phormidium sp. FACHB-592]
MLMFIIPVKSQRAATSWPALSKLFDRCLRSVCNQTSTDFQVLVVCNERPQTSFEHPNVTYLEVDFPPPKADYGAKVDDRAKRVVAGLLAVRDLQPSHVMSVDADDCISQQIAAFVSQHKDSNGWYVNSGYEYEEGSHKISIRRKDFHKICGTCNIINYRLFSLPEKMLPYEELTGYDRFLGGHPLAKGDLAERGAPIEPLPFPGVVFVRDSAGESVSMQETLLAKLKRNPKEVLRGIKKAVMAPMNEQLLTNEVRENFSLFPIR